MKKKLLSLVLAGAMLATTSVSAFAEDREEVTVGSNGAEQPVDITGNVANDSNQILPGTITVTVPTTMAFTINKDGNIEDGEITIRNKSTESVEVVAKEFTDSKPKSGIIVKKAGELATVTNTNENRYVSLTLEGEESVGLISDKEKTGLVNLSTNDEYDKNDNPSLGTIIPKGELKLSLTGTVKGNPTSGKYEAPNKPINNRFTLKLKIQKTTKEAEVSK